MKEKEIKEKLCLHDGRNPYCTNKESQSPDWCQCENCYNGVSRMAKDMLRLRGIIKVMSDSERVVEGWSAERICDEGGIIPEGYPIKTKLGELVVYAPYYHYGTEYTVIQHQWYPTKEEALNSEGFNTGDCVNSERPGYHHKVEYEFRSTATPEGWEDPKNQIGYED